MGISRGPEDYITASLVRSRILTGYTHTPSNTARTSLVLLPTPTRIGLFSITSPFRVSDELDRTSIYISKSRRHYALQSALHLHLLSSLYHPLPQKHHHIFHLHLTSPLLPHALRLTTVTIPRSGAGTRVIKVYASVAWQARVVHHVFALGSRVDAAEFGVVVVAGGVFARGVIEVAHDEIIQFRSVEDCLIWFFVVSSWECRLCGCGYEDSGKYNAKGAFIYGRCEG
jgi:hypothetical protein